MRDRSKQSGTPVRRIVIVGGGTAGWMAAAALSAHLAGSGISITLVESTAIGTVGVGEATIPTIRRFYARLGMSDAEVIAACDATCKLGIRFVDWQPGRAFVHPFGHFGQDLRGIDFHQYWLRERAEGRGAPFEDYSLGAKLAAEGRASLPAANPNSRLAVFDWALHFDAARFAAHMRKFAEGNGVTRIDARIDEVRSDGDTIAAVVLDDGREIAGDLFIDCSGFRGLLIAGTLNVGYQDWSHWLMCDRAFAVQGERMGPPPSSTTVTARNAGWQWRIPLATREGNGLVFSSRFQDENAARAELLAHLPGKALAEPRMLSFTAGRRSAAWKGNCVALGLAAGFLEPLESTSIALIETGIERLKQLFPTHGCDPAVMAEFNAQTAEEMERVRDFLILHYKLNTREGDFWRECREMAVPETLEHKLAVWRARGAFVRYRWEMFAPASWLAIYSGFDQWPDGPADPGVAAVDGMQLTQGLAAMRASIREAVDDAPMHAELLEMFAKGTGAPARQAATA